MAYSLQPINITAATTLSDETHGQAVCTVNAAAGVAITLPDATGSGTRFHLILGTTVTSNSTTIKVPDADNTMTGVAIIANDTDNSVSGFETAATTDTITFNGTTTGGIKGDSVELIDISANLWFVRVMGSASGTEATPFSATV